MKPTPSLSSELPLPATVEACHEVMREWWGLMQEMRQRLQVLEEQLKLNSRTSSKPPSSDGLVRGSRTSKLKSGRNVGAQPGHKGSHRAMLPSDAVDQQVLCRPEPQCALCGKAVIVDEDKPIRHQVFDLPPVKPQVTQYLRLRGVCNGCGKVTIQVPHRGHTVVRRRPGVREHARAPVTARSCPSASCA